VHQRCGIIHARPFKRMDKIMEGGEKKRG